MVSIDHFGQELREQMGRAVISGAKGVLINSLDMCSSIPKGGYATESCCDAMQDEMKPGDVLLKITIFTSSLGMPASSSAPYLRIA
jgi:hypothetical protein